MLNMPVYDTQTHALQWLPSPSVAVIHESISRVQEATSACPTHEVKGQTHGTPTVVLTTIRIILRAVSVVSTREGTYARSV